MPRLSPKVILFAFIVIGALGIGAILYRVSAEVENVVYLPDVDYNQSTACQNCHPDHYETWHQTFHRTMTQFAGPEAVLADFNLQSYTYQNITSNFFEEDGQYFIETLSGIPDTEGEMQVFPIVFTIGSRRVQQYIARVGDRHVRLPLAWNIEEERWFHLNGGFLDPDGTDFNTHTSLWDANCIFCHNVKAQPGFDFQQQTFDAGVAELGIACEACHGPGKLHVERNTNPVRRYFLYLTDRDPTIYSPIELPQMQQIQLCGHCHGQRLPNPRSRVEQFVTEGDPFTPGDDLNWFTEPIFIDSVLEDVDLSLRFWADGTPRLTAHEYQGILLSPEHLGTEFTCTTCHNMHGGDPKGMINPENRGNNGCTQCHSEYIELEDVAAHTQHDPEGSGSSCYACHMPNTVYGLLGIHPSHRIRNPDPSRAWAYEMPESCTLCHTNESAIWAAGSFTEMFETPLASDLPSGSEFEIAENIRVLLSGDVIQRAAAVHALSAGQSYIDDPVARLWAAPFLIQTMQDSYPAIRHFAYRELNTLVEAAGPDNPSILANFEGLPFFDQLAETESRARTIDKFEDWWHLMDKSGIPHPGPAVPLDENLQLIPSVTDGLIAQQDSKAISIGE